MMKHLFHHLRFPSGRAAFAALLALLVISISSISYASGTSGSAGNAGNAGNTGTTPPAEEDQTGITVTIGGGGGGGVSGGPCPFCINCCQCCSLQSACGSDCACTSTKQTNVTIPYITEEFLIHREWLVKVVWEAHMLPAMLLMTEQLTAAAMQQVVMIGTILDAKHQLETQALFQELHAEAHKDYQVSESVCKFGTNTRSLAAADRNAEYSHVVLGSRLLQRLVISGDVLSSGPESDLVSRFDQFMKVYCNPDDNAKGLSRLCGSGGADKKRHNKDVDYATTVDRVHTLKLDLTPEGDYDHTDRGASPDEEDLFALAANLYGHKLPFPIPEFFIAEANGAPKEAGAFAILDLRALAAKRTVAHNSFAAIAAMKTKGGEEVKPYMEILLKEIGIPAEEIQGMLSDKPSYYAQMDVLTKKIYQDPVFYAELYGKPANVERKNVAMRALSNMQKRDIYRSLLRSEATMAVWLEMELMKLQEPTVNEVNRLDQEGMVAPIP